MSRGKTAGIEIEQVERAGEALQLNLRCFYLRFAEVVQNPRTDQAMMSPIMVITTSISTSVKPCWFSLRRDPSRRCPALAHPTKNPPMFLTDIMTNQPLI